jgi:hypothetical protein
MVVLVSAVANASSSLLHVEGKIVQGSEKDSLAADCGWRGSSLRKWSFEYVSGVLPGSSSAAMGGPELQIAKQGLPGP